MENRRKFTPPSSPDFPPWLDDTSLSGDVEELIAQLLQIPLISVPLENITDNLPDTSSSTLDLDRKIDNERIFLFLENTLPRNTQGKRRGRVLQLLLKGVSRQEIAKDMDISLLQISRDVNYISAIIRKVEDIYRSLLLGISERQKKVLYYALSGKSQSDIAVMLGISDATVSRELSHIRSEASKVLRSEK